MVLQWINPAFAAETKAINSYWPPRNGQKVVDSRFPLMTARWLQYRFTAFPVQRSMAAQEY